MKNKVYASLNGIVTEAVGPQPKEALLFAAPNTSTTQVIREQRAKRIENSRFIKERFDEAFRRQP